MLPYIILVISLISIIVMVYVHILEVQSGRGTGDTFWPKFGTAEWKLKVLNRQTWFK